MKKLFTNQILLDQLDELALKQGYFSCSNWIQHELITLAETVPYEVRQRIVEGMDIRPNGKTFGSPEEWNKYVHKLEHMTNNVAGETKYIHLNFGFRFFLVDDEKQINVNSLLGSVEELETSINVPVDEIDMTTSKVIGISIEEIEDFIGEAYDE